MSSQPRLWEKFLAWAEYWYNMTYHQSTGMTPFEAVYGRQPPPLIHYVPGSTDIQEVDQTLRSRDDILRELKDNLTTARN